MSAPVRIGRRCRLSTAERYWLMMAENPPTTAEWLAYLRRIDCRQMYWTRGRWSRPPRPFIAPHAHPWGDTTCLGLRHGRLP